MSRFLAFFAFALFSSVAWTQDLVVSTQPIYLIAQEVTKGIEKPTLLLADQSGHDVSLTPMHRKIIQDAGLVIWLGRAHEAPLDKLLTPNDKAVSILDSGIINALPLRNTRGDALKNTIDTHVWLDPNNAVRIGFFIAGLRSQQMPEYKERYWNNAKLFAQKMLQASAIYSQSTQARPYWSFHDGMVTTAITCMDYGYVASLFDCTTGLFDAMAPHVIFCRHHGTWYFTGCRDCRSNGVAPVDGCGFYCGLVGGDPLGFA
jgi:zinc transport system substrate-binding protein